MIRTLLILALGALGWWLLLAPTASAQAREVRELDVSPGFGGLGKAGRWLPVRVVVANDGPGFSGEVRLVTRLAGGGPRVAYAEAIDLPSRSRKQVYLTAPAPGLANDLKVELVADGQEIATRDVPVRLLGASEVLVGVLAEDDAPVSGLGSLQRGGATVRTARLTTADLPSNPIALQALDALVVRNAASDRLTTDQRAALRAWIEAGGQLIVCGGPGWRRSVEGLEDLLPLETLESREPDHLRAFGHYAGRFPPDGRVLVASGSPILGARVFLSQNGVPLLAERWLGQGRVTFLAADPSLEPFRGWPAAEDVWQRILVGGRQLPPSPGEPSGGSLEPQLRDVLADLMDLGLPGPGWLALFLLAYVVCIGPGQYWLLRRIDRREWAWVGFPVLAIGFAGLAYLGGSWIRGPDVRLGAISIVRSPLGAQSAVTDTFVGLVAPSRRSYDLAFVDGSSPRPLTGRAGLADDWAVIYLGAPARLPGLRLEGRTLQGFNARGFGVAPMPVKAELRTSPERLEGFVTNVGPDKLEGAVVVAGGVTAMLGDIEPGESRPISLALPIARSTANGPSLGIPGSAILPPQGDPRDSRWPLMGALVESGRGVGGESSGGALLLAWSSAMPPRLTADGIPLAGTAGRVLEQALPVSYGDETVVVPPGLLDRTLLEGVASSRGGMQGFQVRGPLVFQYDLPGGLDLTRIDRLSVHVGLVGKGVGAGSGGLRVSLLRWADRTWVDVPVGASGVADVSDGAGFVDGGAIRLRAEPIVPDVLIQQLDLSLEGAR